MSDKYTSQKCADDLGVDYMLFREIWKSLHTQMYTGACTYENVLEKICDAAGILLTPDKLAYCVARRKEAKTQCFTYRHDNILQMLETLKSNGYRLALCSNCFSEEAEVFHESVLYRYFDAVVLSYEVGCAKPDEAIYKLCTERLGVKPAECLYVGDGGSRELYGAKAVGMTAVRALWFLNKYASNIELMPFAEANHPSNVIELICGRQVRT